MADGEEHPRPSFVPGHPVRASRNVQFLTDNEIDQFVDDLDHNDDGYIHYDEVELKLDQAYDELFPNPSYRHLFHLRPSDDTHNSPHDLARHAFLQQMMGGSDEQLTRTQFAQLVRDWHIPSLKQISKEEDGERDYIRHMSTWRKIRAYWAVHGPELGFIGLVVACQVALGVWQLVKYLTTDSYLDTYGWGVVMAKTCAGALYPTFFFLILSMSRYFSTWLRRSYIISRFFNWDLSQEFHIRISCVALILTTLHVIGHLSGSFVSGSKTSHQGAVNKTFGHEMGYIDYVSSRPGFTGIPALGIFYLISLLSIPHVRRWNYEVFQLGHVLMFPMFGLLAAHGTGHYFQFSMFGYFLIGPVLLVLVERLVRFLLGFHGISAIIRVLDGETVEITAKMPPGRLWKYKAGQYIFLQVPEISFFQWHPFTVSFCRENKIMIHIKTDGNWTGRLRALGDESQERRIKVGINGPFGAPAQRFYDFNHSILVGAGIGVTPFSGILADLQHNDNLDHGGPEHRHTVPQSVSTDAESAKNDGHGHPMQDLLHPPGRVNTSSADLISKARDPQPRRPDGFASGYRRVDFHWMVRDRNYLRWLSDLLNEVSISQVWHRENEERPHLDIRMNTHVTAKRRSIVTHVYRWLLEMHRTEEHPASPLTGLLNPTRFGRPDFNVILDEHYDEMRHFVASRRQEAEVRGEDTDDLDDLKVGVFYCGAPVVGEILADKCHELTTRGREDGSKITYHFMMEVFG